MPGPIGSTRRWLPTGSSSSAASPMTFPRSARRLSKPSVVGLDSARHDPIGTRVMWYNPGLKNETWGTQRTGPLEWVLLQFNALPGNRAAEGDGIGRRKAGQAAKNGKLRPQFVSFAAGSQNPTLGLFGESDGLVGQQTGHCRRN